MEMILPPCARILRIVPDMELCITTDFCTALRLPPTWRREVQLIVRAAAFPTLFLSSIVGD